MCLIQLSDIRKTYRMGEIDILAVDGVSFEVDYGEVCIIVGQSGAGKTTVLNILGGMDAADSGSAVIDKNDISNYNRKELVDYRRHDIGFVFQFYNLVQNLTAIENVELATEISKNPLNPEHALELVGLKDRTKNFPSQLSGGEQQRVAIARALAKNPKLLLCDEPTGALDYATGKSILKLLQEMSRKNKMSVVIVTHNSALVQMADRVIRMKSGKVVENYINQNPCPVEELEW